MEKKGKEMAIVIKLLSASLIFLLVFQGAQAGICGPTDLLISQKETGRIIRGQPEHQVILSNECHCPQSNLTLTCGNITSAEPTDPNAIKFVGDNNCLIKSGKPIREGYPFRFTYAWSHLINFTYVSSYINC